MSQRVKQFKVFLCAVITLCLSACSTTTLNDATVPLSDKAALRLADASAQIKADNWQQVMSVHYNEEQHTLLSQLSITPENGINLVVMTSQGLPVFTLQKRPNSDIVSKKMMPINAVDPRFILADIMLVHWPVDELNALLIAAQVKEQQGNRYVYQDNEQLVKITFANGITRLENVYRGYQIEFRKVN